MEDKPNMGGTCALRVNMNGSESRMNIISKIDYSSGKIMINESELKMTNSDWATRLGCLREQNLAESHTRLFLQLTK